MLRSFPPRRLRRCCSPLRRPSPRPATPGPSSVPQDADQRHRSKSRPAPGRSACSPSSSPKTSGGASSTSAAPRRSSRSSSSIRAASPSSTAAARCRAGRWSARWPTRASCRPGSNLGKGQVKAADYFLEPNIVSANKNSGGGGIGAAAGALGGLFGGARQLRRRHRRRDQRQEGRGQRHPVGGQCPHDRGICGRRLCPQEGHQLGRRRRRRLVGRLRRGRRPRLPEYRDRPGDRARLSRRLHQAGRPARRASGRALRRPHRRPSRPESARPAFPAGRVVGRPSPAFGRTWLHRAPRSARFRAKSFGEFFMRLANRRLSLLLASASLLAACATAPAVESADRAARRPSRRRAGSGRAGAGLRAGQPGRHPAPEVRARQRPDRHRPRGPQGAGRRGQHLVQCRVEGRAQGQDRLRPSVRASDVQRLGESAGRLLRISAADRRDRLQRHDLVRPHQLFPDGAAAARSTRALFMESDRMGYLLGAVTQEKLDNQIGVVQNEKRQGDNRPGGLVDYEVLGQPVPRRPPLSARHDRFDGRPRRGQPGRREAVVHRQIWPEQCGAGAGRRHQRRRGAAAGREIFRRDPARPGQQPGRGRRADARRAQVDRDEGPRRGGAAAAPLGGARPAVRPARRARPRRVDPRRPRQLAARQDPGPRREAGGRRSPPGCSRSTASACSRSPRR